MNATHKKKETDETTIGKHCRKNNIIEEMS
jgi:hypothetical protein